jgi:hypothetical protein
MLGPTQLTSLFAAPCALLLAAGAALGEAPDLPLAEPSALPGQVMLQYRFTPGQAKRLISVGKMSVLGTIEGKQALPGVRSTFRMEASSRCLGQRDGLFTLRIDIQNPTMRMVTQGAPFQVDFIGPKRTVRYKGKVLPPEQVPAFIAKLKPPVALANKTERLSRRGDLLVLTSRDQAASPAAAVDGMVPLPDGPVGVGDTWETERLVGEK